MKDEKQSTTTEGDSCDVVDSKEIEAIKKALTGIVEDATMPVDDSEEVKSKLTKEEKEKVQKDLHEWLTQEVFPFYI